ncbi:hypothetical protein FRC03_001144 [Tulasnella sp. 419]|nr:hypothetical protein FRC02_006460 [Tulasnella sp. 418]KAG8947237.1 hypothetical protein FRC03_001144 [Tulasnella sp. 419]
MATIDQPPILEIDDRQREVMGLSTSSPIESRRHRSVNSSKPPPPVNEPKRDSDPPLPNIDDNETFWSTYDREASNYDAELIDGWNKSLDILLLFAGLFSAINTAFIIESYQGLQPDPAEITNILLRTLIIHRSDNITLSDEDLNPGSPNSSAVSVNSIFFASLSYSLTAAFGAVTAKQWLTAYSNKGSTKALHEKCRDRQMKFAGLETWHLRFIMDILPMLLQLSLLLFLVGLVQFLWALEKRVAMVQLVLSAAGVVIYGVSVLLGVVYPNSPFQMPLTIYILRCIRFSGGVGLCLWNIVTTKTERAVVRVVELISPITKHVGDSISCPALSRIWASLRRCIPPFPLSSEPRPRVTPLLKTFNPSHNGLDDSETAEQTSEVNAQEMMIWDDRDELAAKCIVWMLENSEHPDMTLAALNAALQLPSGLLFSLIKEREDLIKRLSSFHKSLLPPPFEILTEWLGSWQDRAILSGMAMSHIFKSGRSVLRRHISASGFKFSMAAEMEMRSQYKKVYLEQAMIAYSLGYDFMQQDRSKIDAPPCLPTLWWLNERLSSILHVERLPQPHVGLRGVQTASARKSSLTRSALTSLALDAVISAAFDLDVSPSEDWARTVQILRDLINPKESSRSIISHIAIAAAAARWKFDSTQRCQNEILHFGRVRDGFEQLLLRSIHVMNKGEMVLENVAFALLLVDDIEDSRGIQSYFNDLINKLLIAVKDLPRDRNDLDRYPWSKLLSNLGPNHYGKLLQLSRANHNDPSVQDTVFGILSDYNSHDAWIPRLTGNDGEDVLRLLKYGISQREANYYPLNSCITLLTQHQDDDLFFYIFLSKDSLLSDATNRDHVLGCSDNLLQRCLLEFNPSPPVMQICRSNQITLVLYWLEDGRKNSTGRHYRWENFNTLRRFLNHIMEDTKEGLSWPAYLSSLEDLTVQSDLKWMWLKEYYLLFWRVTQCWVTHETLPTHWSDSPFFKAEIMDSIDKYYYEARERGYAGVDYKTLRNYFERALQYCPGGGNPSTATSQGDDEELSKREKDQRERRGNLLRVLRELDRSIIPPSST